MSCVLDASVTLAWLYDEEADERSEAALDRVAENGALVPPVWVYEIANGVWVGEHRGRISWAQGQRFLGLLEELPIEIPAVGLGRVWHDVLAVSRTYDLAAYDAAYIELASREGVPLLSKDQQQCAAAKQAGVALQ